MAIPPANRLLPFALLPLLVACGGRAQLTPPPAVPREGSPPTVAVHFTIALPARTGAAARRDPRYVSASTKSATVMVTPAGGVRAAPVLIACTSTACSGQVPAPVGTDTFAVSLYDAPNATGKLLSTGSAVQTVVLDAANVVSVTFDGVVAGLRLGLSQASTTRCFATTIGVAVSALDADGNTIVGPGSYADANGNPLTITLNDADTSRSTSLAQTTLTAPPSGPIRLTYDGKAATQATITASAPGVTNATATLAFPASTAHNLYAMSVPQGTSGAYRVVVFPSSANGNVAPLRWFGLSGGPFAGINGLAIDAVCDAYVGNTGPNAVDVLPVGASGAVPPVAVLSDATSAEVSALALDSSGRLGVTYAGAPGTDEIAFFAVPPSSSTGAIGHIAGAGTGLAFPDAIAFASDGSFFVANAIGNTVTAYARTASGNASPSRTIVANVTSAIDDASALAVGPDGSLYVANAGAGHGGTGSVDSVTVYAPGANGYTMPARTITGSATGLSEPIGLAVDASGNVYVCNGGAAATTITVYGPGANGNVAPARTIAGSATAMSFSGGPTPIGLDASGALYVLDRASPMYGTSVLVFAPGANGNVAPVRAIPGNATTEIPAYNPFALAVDSAGTIYLDASDNAQTHGVIAFAPGSTGSVPPSRTLSGPAFSGALWAMATDAAGNLYIERTSATSPSQVEVFSAGANGAVSPSRTLTAPWDEQFEATPIAADQAGDIWNAGVNGAGGSTNTISRYAVPTNGTASPNRVLYGGAIGPYAPSGVGFDGAGSLYVLCRGDQTVKIYAPGANGLAAPTRTIQGIPASTIWGLLVDTDGTTYVSTMNFSGTSAYGAIVVYAPGANGMATPVRTIAGAATTLGKMQAMSFGP